MVKASSTQKWMTGKSAGLYFHIPFCQHKCAYCHFYVLPNKTELHDQLLGALKREWELQRPRLQGKTITTLYFGGGTPALIGPHRIKEIIDWIRQDPEITLLPQAEITLEANPENVTAQEMSAFREAGVNRVSLGLQVLDDSLLARIERQHDAKRAIDAVWEVHNAGFDNITVDLIYDLPKQSLASWKKTLDEVTQLPIQHLSLYNLIVEPRSVFFKWRHEIEAQMPNSEDSLAMLQAAKEKLAAIGLEQYEISAFAKPGFEAQHNQAYWLGKPFLGLGPSAFSYWDHKRFRNVEHLGRYSRDLEAGRLPIDFEEELEPSARRRELLCIALRLLRGVDLREFEAQHGVLDQEVYGAIDSLIQQGWLQQSGKRYLLTDQGRLFYDSLASEII